MFGKKWDSRPLLGAFLLVVLACHTSLPAAASPDEVTLLSQDDSYVQENHPDQQKGSKSTMMVQSDSNKDRRSFVTFDLSSIPSGSTILSATLSLHMKDAPQQSRTLEAQRVNASWSQSTITWNNQPGVSGASSTTATGTTDGTWVTWDVTTDVQDIIQYQTAANYGWRIKDSSEDSSHNYVMKFDTREANSSDRHPRLIISYASDSDPTIGEVSIYTADHSTGVTAMDPQVEFAAKVSVTDLDPLADLSTVKVTIFFDDDGDDDPADVPSSGDDQTAAILTCTVGSPPTWSIDAGATSTWAIVGAHCVQPTLTNTSGDFWFHFKPGKVSTQATDWDVYAIADDGGASPGSSYDDSAYNMNWYGEITINTSGIDWGTVELGSDFGANPQTGISATFISNGDYNQEIKSDPIWSSGGASVSLNAAGSPGTGEFSLMADDTAVLGSAILVSNSYANFGSGGQTAESGDLETANTIWLKMGPTGIPAVNYSGMLYYRIAP